MQHKRQYTGPSENTVQKENRSERTFWTFTMSGPSAFFWIPDIVFVFPSPHFPSPLYRWYQPGNGGRVRLPSSVLLGDLYLRVKSYKPPECPLKYFIKK